VKGTKGQGRNGEFFAPSRLWPFELNGRIMSGILAHSSKVASAASKTRSAVEETGNRRSNLSSYPASSQPNRVGPRATSGVRQSATLKVGLSPGLVLRRS